jgi:hypothetical protein
MILPKNLQKISYKVCGEGNLITLWKGSHDEKNNAFDFTKDKTPVIQK